MAQGVAAATRPRLPQAMRTPARRQEARSTTMPIRVRRPAIGLLAGMRVGLTPPDRTTG